jgi:hypothetical protein
MISRSKKHSSIRNCVFYSKTNHKQWIQLVFCQVSTTLDDGIDHPGHGGIEGSQIHIAEVLVQSFKREFFSLCREKMSTSFSLFFILFQQYFNSV